MKKLILAATAFVLSNTVAAQTAQEHLNAPYDRALAAGYKALMLCSGIANAEANGATRSPESIHQWELTGIQTPLDAIIRDLPFKVVRRPSGQIAHVQVEWVEDMPDRVAVYGGRTKGCAVMPIGTDENVSDPSEFVPFDKIEIEDVHYALGHMPPPPPKLAPMKAAFTNRYGEGRTTAVIVRVVEDGNAKVNYMQFAPGFDRYTPQRTWSVAKSIAATLVGAAVYRNEVQVSDSARLGADDSDPRRAITVDHALRMASGRYSDTAGNRTDPLYWGGSTIDERAQNWPLVSEPGTVYRYANNDTLAAVKAIESTFVDQPPPDFFSKIGVDRTVAEADWQGNYVLSSQVWSTAWDLAAIGQLHLNDGVWNRKRLLPEGWLDYVSAPSGPQPDGRSWGYGAGWWLLNKEEGVPEDTILAAGNRGQYIVVVPSRDVVIVRRGEDMVGTRFDIAAFTRDVLAALED